MGMGGCVIGEVCGSGRMCDRGGVGMGGCVIGEVCGSGRMCDRALIS